MLHISVVDDDREHSSVLTGYLERYFSQTQNEHRLPLSMNAGCLLMALSIWRICLPKPISCFWILLCQKQTESKPHAGYVSS